MVILIRQEAFLPLASDPMRLSAAAIWSLGGMKIINLTDECAEKLFLLGWHHPNQRGAAGMDIWEMKNIMFSAKDVSLKTCNHRTKGLKQLPRSP